jgi:hypothetical protein
MNASALFNGTPPGDRRRCRVVPARHALPFTGGLCSSRGARGKLGHSGSPRRGLFPHPAGCDDARRGWLRSAAPHPPTFPHARPDADCPRRYPRSYSRARIGRRRLSAQALRSHRAIGANPCHSAQGAAAAGTRSLFAGRYRARWREPHGLARRRDSGSDHRGVRPACGADARRRQHRQPRELVRNVLGREFSPFDRSIDTHVCNLRRKLGPFEDGAERIKGVRGAGYLYAWPARQGVR